LKRFVEKGEGKQNVFTFEGILWVEASSKGMVFLS